MALFFVGTTIMAMMGTIPWSLWALVTVGIVVIMGTLIFMGTVNIVCTVVSMGSDGHESKETMVTVATMFFVGIVVIMHTMFIVSSSHL